MNATHVYRDGHRLKLPQHEPPPPCPNDRSPLPWAFDAGGAPIGPKNTIGAGCVERALTIATGIPRATIDSRCAELDLAIFGEPSQGPGVHALVIDAFLGELGGWSYVHRAGYDGGPCMSHELPTSGTLLVLFTLYAGWHHALCVRDGVARDLADPTELRLSRCIAGYFQKES